VAHVAFVDGHAELGLSVLPACRGRYVVCNTPPAYAVSSVLRRPVESKISTRPLARDEV
jgi:prepilin-type processing-associated H-X9-DG protein